MKAVTLTNLRRGFTLLELLVVLALVFGITVLALAGYKGVIQSVAITTGAAMIEDALTSGRAEAVAQNTTVEVRIYAVPPSGGGAPAYAAMQLHWLKADMTTPAIASPVLLSSWVVVDPTATYSPLIASPDRQPVTIDAADPRMNSQTRVFHFLPDGSTDLNPATNWFMTVRAASQSAPAHFPANWASIRVDPATGRAQVYRP